MLEIKDENELVELINNYKDAKTETYAEIEQTAQDIKPLVDIIINYRHITNNLIEQNKELQAKIVGLDEKLQKVHEELCKYDWKNSTSEQIYNQLSSLYSNVFKESKEEVKK